jgi:hypothetical protein
MDTPKDISPPTPAQIARLFALGYARGWQPAQVRAFAKERCGKTIGQLNWMEARELAKAIQDYPRLTREEPSKSG